MDRLRNAFEEPLGRRAGRWRTSAAVLVAVCGVALGCAEPSSSAVDDDDDNNNGTGGTQDAPESSTTADGSAGTGSTSDDPDGGSTTGQPGDDHTGDETGEDPPAWSVENVYGVPNFDDDDEDGQPDWYQYVFDTDDDVSKLEIPGVAAGHSVHLSFSGDLLNVRVWDGDTFAIGTAQDIAPDEYTFVPGPEGAVLDVEFGDYDASGVLTIRQLDAAGAEIERLEVTLRSSPMILNHHLQPTEHVWVVNVGDNQSMIDDYADVLGDAFTSVPGQSYGWDVWIQDEIEFATAIGDDGQRLNTVIDSIRDRGLDPFAENALVGPDFIAQTWGNPAQATTWDSFGNLEASPPVTVGGTTYPWGRIFYGRMSGYGLHPQLAQMLQSQRVQAPFEVDTLWLCVGHVDEFSSFVPDPASDQGFKLLLSDTTSAYELLEGLPSSMSLPYYGADHGYDTVGEILADNGLRALNEDIQSDELDPIRAQFKSELGLDDDDIILVPSLFESISSCGGYTAALIPGMVNLVVTDVGGEPHLFVPDPFFRTSGSNQASDPFIEAFAASMPDGLELHFVDNWDAYHLNLGEVHCGTNVLRTPASNWWEVGLELLEGSGS